MGRCRDGFQAKGVAEPQVLLRSSLAATRLFARKHARVHAHTVCMSAVPVVPLLHNTGTRLTKQQHHVRLGGNACPARARCATFLLTIPTSAPDLPSHGEAPQVDHVALHTFPTKQLHNKAIYVNSATPTVICIVLNKQHWSHKCGCQCIQYNSAPYTHHKLRRWNASDNTTHTLLPHPLPHLAWRPSCFGQSKLEAGHAPMVRRGGVTDLPPNANSIAFGSAPRREVDSQPLSRFARPAVSQTAPHSLGFLSVADAAPSTGETFRLRPSLGRMVMRLTGVFLVGGSNPGRVNTPPPPPPPPKVSRPGFEPPTENFASTVLPFDRRLCDSHKFPHCLEPSERKLLDPPPQAPPQKNDI